MCLGHHELASVSVSMVVMQAPSDSAPTCAAVPAQRGVPDGSGRVKG